MTPQDAQDKIQDVTKITVQGFLTTALQYADVDADDTEAQPQESGKAHTWARLSVKFGAQDQAAFRSADQKLPIKQLGVATLQVFAPKGQGTVVSRDIAMLWVTAMLKTRGVSNLTFRNGSTQDVGIDRHWYNYNGTIEFQYVAQH